MGLITENIIVDILIVTTTLLVLIFSYFQHTYKYWEKRNAPFLSPKFPLGNSQKLITKSVSFGLESIKYYDEVKKKGLKFAGIYTITRPVLVVIDPDYIRDILSKDFQNFVDRGFYFNAQDDPISAHLFAENGAQWKHLRNKLTPTFTSGKMKMMFQAILDISEYMIEAIEKFAMEKKEIDIKQFLSNFTTDVIGSCAFGINCNSFKSPDAEFPRMGRAIFQIGSLIRMIKLILIANVPETSRKFGLCGTRKDVSKFFIDVVAKTVKHREENDISRPDFMQLVIDLKNSSKDTANPFTLEQLTANVFLFFIAGFDTSSTTMTFTLYELCKHPDIQERVRKEIDEVLAAHGGNITYENLGEMKYLQQVIDEAQRLYPPLVNLTRRCVKNYNLRDTDIVIEKGTPVLIPLYSLHRDPEYYPDPDKFDPERFTPENKQSRHPYVHMPFGEGPRNCIGLRFGLMQVKVGLVTILRKFRLKISPSTKMPLILDDQVLLLKSIGTLYITAEKI